MKKLATFILINMILLAFSLNFKLISYEATCTQRPASYLLEETQYFIMFHYPVIDQALATPSQIGTLTIKVPKILKVDSEMKVSPVNIYIEFYKDYYKLFERSVVPSLDIAVYWSGEYKGKYKLRANQLFYLLSTSYRNLYLENYKFSLFDTIVDLKSNMDLSKPFKFIFKLTASLYNTNVRSVIIPWFTNIVITYSPD